MKHLVASVIAFALMAGVWVASAQVPAGSGAAVASASATVGNVPPPPASSAQPDPVPVPIAPPAPTEVATPAPDAVPAHVNPIDAGTDVLDAAVDAETPSDAGDADLRDVIKSEAGAAVVPASRPPAASASTASPPPPPPSASSPKDEEPPLWNILPILSEPGRDGSGDLAQQILPSLGFGERGNLLAYFVLLLASALGANLAGRGRRKLPVRGVLPRILAGLHVGLRTFVVLFALALVAKWIPASYAPVFLWVALAAAAAAGWSARDFLPDLFAGVVLLVERRVRPGTWVTGSTFAGEIETLGPRAVRLRDAEGRVLSVPNRKLLAGPVAIDTSRRPRTDVVIRVPEGVSPSEARQAIEDAALLSPWRVLRHRPEVRREADDPRAWRVRLRLLEPRFRRAFESALVDHVEENLRQDALLPGHVELASEAQEAPPS